MRRISALLVTSAIALTACGGSSNEGESTAESAAPIETPAPVDTPAPPVDTRAPPVETEAPAAEATTEPVTEATNSATGIAVTLSEWAIETPTEIAAGTVTFDVLNDGSFSHQFGVARGNSYEELPQISGGAIDEAALGDDFLGRTANLQTGSTETISFDLEPGNYVLFCNINGVASHAAQGQVLSVTVS